MTVTKTIRLRFPVSRFAAETLGPSIRQSRPWEWHAFRALEAFNDALTCLAQGSPPYAYWPLHLARGTRLLIPERHIARRAYPFFQVQIHVDAEIWADRLEARLCQTDLFCRRDLTFSALEYWARIHRVRTREGGDVCFPGLRPAAARIFLPAGPLRLPGPPTT